MVNEPTGDLHKIIHNFPQPLALRPARTCMLIRQIFGMTHYTLASLSQGIERDHGQVQNNRIDFELSRG